MSVEREVKVYRILFLVTAAVGFAAAVVAYQAKRDLARSINFVDFSWLPQNRDKKFPFTVEAYGFKYHGTTGGVVDEHVVLFGLYEKDRLFFMRDFLQKAQIDQPVVIDVGANTGNHALFLSRHAAKVHAFEPYPPVIERFRANLALNPEIRNIEVHEVGLGAAEAELTFNASPDDDMGSGSFQPGRAREKGHHAFERKLKVVTGDAWLAERETGPVVLIKIDAEAYEEAVLKGLRQTMEKHRPVVVVEVGALPTGTIATFAQLAGLFPENYEFLAFENALEGVVGGHYRLRPLDEAVFASDLRRKLDAVAYPRERAATVPH